MDIIFYAIKIYKARNKLNVRKGYRAVTCTAGRFLDQEVINLNVQNLIKENKKLR